MIVGVNVIVGVLVAVKVDVGVAVGMIVLVGVNVAVTVGGNWLAAVVSEGTERESTAEGRTRELTSHATNRKESNARILSRTDNLSPFEQFFQVRNILRSSSQDIESSLG